MVSWRGELPNLGLKKITKHGQSYCKWCRMALVKIMGLRKFYTSLTSLKISASQIIIRISVKQK